MASSTGFLAEGRNAWRVVPARRLTFLVDGAAYFSALAEALARARHSVLIAGWEIDDRVRLLRDADDGLPAELGARLKALLRRERGLRVHVLGWDFAMIYAFERGLLPLFRLRFARHRRLHFRLDDHHPVGASHHQKFVVIDDALAFCGGLDLARARWDTPEHHALDPRRRDPAERPYGPFHDVQAAVEGEAARALGELFRERWRRATGRRLQAPAPVESPWPEALPADFEDVRVGLSRTQPAFDGADGIREVERLHLDAIAAARRFLYVENQYFSSRAVSEALARRLAEPEGPELVLVLPRECPGWLEQGSVGLLRRAHLRDLRAADRHGRLRVCYPTVPGGADVFVHAKLLIADEAFVRVGSANLSNRSMGLDSECDLSLHAAGEPRVEAGIARLRERLLAEHLGCEEREVARVLDESGSLVKALDALADRGERTLRALEEPPPPSEAEGVLELGAALADPEAPIAPDELVERFLMQDVAEAARGPWLRAALALGALLALAAAWRYTPLQYWLSLDKLSAVARGLEARPLAPLWVAGAYVLGSLLMVPLTALIVATMLAFEPAPAFAVALLGATCAAAVGFALGRLFGREPVRRLAGGRLNRLSRRIGRSGVLAIAGVRLFPLAPFTIVNLVAGASHVRWRDFLLGTLLGVLPGVSALALLATGAEAAWREPGLASLAGLAVAAVATVALFALLRRVAGSRR